MPPNTAGSPEFRKKSQGQVDRVARNTWYHSIELPDGTIVPGLIGVDALKVRLQSFPIPENLQGKRILDVGAATGWCSFELERRGAEVLAVDCVEFDEFHEARRLLGSRVEYKVLDVDELTPERLGRFDYVLFLGVLYHLRHPLLGLERICALCTDTAYIESFVTDFHLQAHEREGAGYLMEFYETDELGGQVDNWFGPTTDCLLALCRSAGFVRVQLEYVNDRRAGVTCRRRWESVPSSPAAPSPWINAAVNNRTNAIYFNTDKDEYINLYFKTAETGLSKDAVLVEMDGFGVPLITLSDLGREGWQAGLRMPFVSPGSHEITVRTKSSGRSNAFSIVVGPPARESRGIPTAQDAPEIYAIENNLDGGVLFHGYRNEYVCCYFTLAGTRLQRADIIVETASMALPVDFLTDLGGGKWQTNSRLPANLSDGFHAVRVRVADGVFSNAVKIEVRRAK